jgi:hypothetical protein
MNNAGGLEEMRRDVNGGLLASRTAMNRSTPRRRYRRATSAGSRSADAPAGIDLVGLEATALT